MGVEDAKGVCRDLLVPYTLRQSQRELRGLRRRSHRKSADMDAGGQHRVPILSPDGRWRLTFPAGQRIFPVAVHRLAALPTLGELAFGDDRDHHRSESRLVTREVWS